MELLLQFAQETVQFKSGWDISHPLPFLYGVCHHQWVLTVLALWHVFLLPELVMGQKGWGCWFWTCIYQNSVGTSAGSHLNSRLFFTCRGWNHIHHILLLRFLYRSLCDWRRHVKPPVQQVNKMVPSGHDGVGNSCDHPHLKITDDLCSMFCCLSNPGFACFHPILQLIWISHHKT